MSVSAMASLRPLPRQCARRAPTGLLSLHLPSPAGRFSLGAVVALAPPQRRLRSDSSRPSPPSNEAPPPKKIPPMSFSKFMRAVFRASLRNLAVALSPRGVRAAYRESPVLIASVLAVLVFTIGLGAVALTSFFRAFYNPNFSRYPKPVADTLRRAIYYTNVKPDPDLALRYYQKALEQCTEHGLDLFSDEVLGIRIQASHWLLKINNYKTAIVVLESILADCQKWIRVMEQCVQDGKVDSAGRYKPSPDEAVQAAVEASAQKPSASSPQASAVSSQASQTSPQASPASSQASPASLQASLASSQASPASTLATPTDDTSQDSQPPPSETLWHKRQRLLLKAIGASVRLGELYSDEHVLEPEKSHPHLLWAVETSLREFQRRKAEGLKPGEEDWISPEEFGGAMEMLGRDYEAKSQFQLAIPLFFQALRLCDNPCHRAVIMNNISAAFAQHPIFADIDPNVSKALRGIINPATPKSRKDCLEAACNWAGNAYRHAQDVKGDARTPECDEACAVALCNWGDVAAMLGQAGVARAKYNECIDMSRKMDFAQGLKQAQDGLAKLTSTPTSQV